MSWLCATRHTTTAVTRQASKETGDKYSLFGLILLHNNQEILVDLSIVDFGLDGVEVDEYIAEGWTREAVIVFVGLGRGYLWICVSWEV